MRVVSLTFELYELANEKPRERASRAESDRSS